MIRFAENLNKMITAGLGGALEAPSTEVAVGHCIRYLDSSGAVASFETNIAAPIRNLRVTMEPIQAGSGDPSPDNIRPITGRESVTVKRTGKNLFDMDNVPKSMLNCYTAAGETQDRIGCVIELPPGIYTITAYPRVAEGAFIYMNVVTEDNQFVSFEYLVTNIGVNNSKTVTLTDGQKIYIYDQQASAPGATTKFNLRYFQLELGSTATDYEPYDGQSATIPLEITIDPTTLSTLKGDNNVWSDAGNISLEYPYYEETEGY